MFKKQTISGDISWTNPEGQRVSLITDCDELGVVIVQTLPYPNISVTATGNDKPEKIK